MGANLSNNEWVLAEVRAHALRRIRATREAELRHPQCAERCRTASREMERVIIRMDAALTKPARDRIVRATRAILKHHARLSNDLPQ